MLRIAVARIFATNLEPPPTSHASGWTDGMLEARVGMIAENITRVARGEPPHNRIA